MDPEQLERLETALQSEQAKQILGENVTAMLGKGELCLGLISLLKYNRGMNWVIDGRLLSL